MGGRRKMNSGDTAAQDGGPVRGRKRVVRGAPPPLAVAPDLQSDYRGMAQLVEHRTHNPQVAGSSPVPATMDVPSSPPLNQSAAQEKSLTERLRGAVCNVQTGLHPIDQEVLGLYARGMGIRGIAQTTGRAVFQIKALVDSPEGKLYLDALYGAAEMRDAIEADFWDGLRVASGDVLGQALRGVGAPGFDGAIQHPAWKDRLVAVKEVLNREPGHKFTTVTKIEGEVDVRHSVYTSEERSARVKQFLAQARGCTVEELEQGIGAGAGRVRSGGGSAAGANGGGLSIAHDKGVPTGLGDTVPVVVAEEMLV